MLIDTHCHLTSPGLVERIDDVVAAAAAAGVERAILVAEDPADAHRALGLMASRPQLYLVVGVHPHRAGQVTQDHWAALRELLDARQRSVGAAEGSRGPAERVVAVGETGLDFHYDFAPRDRQEEVFRSQLELAIEHDLPVVIHARESEARVCDILADYPRLAGRVVFHCFSGGPKLADRVLALGNCCSFTGVVTFRRAADIQAAAQHVPLDRMMLETDAPYLSPEPMRKVRPNEPALLVHTARHVAALRRVSVEFLAAATTATAEQFFGLPAQPRREP